MSEFIRRAPLSSMADREPTHRFVLDADWAPVPTEEELERREREQRACVRKWRARIYTEKATRYIWEKVFALMIAAGAVFLWAFALALMIGAAAA